MAGTKLYIATSKIWSHYFMNIDRLQDNEDCIAENKDTGYALYLTSNNIFPQLIVYAGDTPVLFRPIQNEDECNRRAMELIMTFIVDAKADNKQESKKSDGVKENPKIVELEMKKAGEDKKCSTSIEDVDDEDEEYQKIIDTIYEREDELTKAMGDLLAVILCEEDYTAVVEGYTEPFINECVDDFMQYLYDSHGISAYRPTIDVDEDTGCEVLKEFPYGWGDES